jgi:glycosyltransferase involved in cell wall biosynthesis
MVIDDGSTDGSREMVREWEREDERIKLIVRNRSPKGANTCRNIGIDNAKGRFIIFLDSDDILADHCLETRIEYNNGRELDFSVFPTGRMDEAGRRWDRLVNNYYNNSEEYVYALLSGNNPWTVMACLWKVKFIRAVRFDEEIHRYQDVDLHIRALAASSKFEVVEGKPDCYYRSHTDSGFKYDAVEQGAIKILEKFPGYIGQLRHNFDFDRLKASAVQFVENFAVRLAWFQFRQPREKVGHVLSKGRSLGLISKWDKQRIEAYIKLESTGIGKVKGMRKIMQAVLLSRIY